MTKIIFNMQTETVDIWRELSDRLGTTMTEVLRQSIHDLHFLAKQWQKGSRVLTLSQDGSWREVILERS